MWKLSIEDDQGHKTVVSLVRDEYSVGRAQDNTIRLTERNISRYHAAIRRTEAGWAIEDRSSYNGCYVNGARVADPRPLIHADLIQLGDYRLEVLDEAAAQLELIGSHANTVPQLPRGAGGAGQIDRLVMLVGPNPGMEYPIVGKNLLIGRGEECDLAINHGSVSRVHAEIVAVGDGRYELIDRNSANGIRINGVEMDRTLLDARDTIELGDIVLKYIPAGMYYRPGAEERQLIAGASLASDGGSPASGLVTEPSRGTLLSPGRIAAAAGLLAIGMLLAVVVVASSPRRPVSQVATNASSDSAISILDEATAQVRQGRLESAHVQVTTQIPETSNARKSAPFLAVEAAWADSLFREAREETDRERKRALLQRIKDTETVDAERRNRALAELNSLDSGGVDVSELPRAVSPPVTSHSGTSTAHATSATFVATRSATPTSTAADASDDTPPPAPTPERTGGVSVDRSSATAGDRATQLRTIAALKAKKAANTATDKDLRILRALCRQHNDPSCSN
jgi:pSer/pThr/pTyr-binding forkhead associated (FHA) protein